MGRANRRLLREFVVERGRKLAPRRMPWTTRREVGAVTPSASPIAVEAVSSAVDLLRQRGIRSGSPSELFAAANDVAWDGGLMLSKADVWIAVYEVGGFDYDSPPPDDTVSRSKP